MHPLKPASRHGTILAVSMMKDEAPDLLEWVAHHLAVGFTDLLVYTNDCSDGTDEMLIRLEQLGLAHHRRNVIAKGRKPQPSAIKHAQAEPLVAAADWVMVFDADEFFAVSHPSGTLDGMLDDTVAQGADGLVVTWRVFGSSGICDWSRAPVTEQFIRAAPPDWNKGWGVKTLFRFDPDHWKLGIHRPFIKNKWLETAFPDTVKWLNGSGRPMEDYFKFRGWRSIRRTVGYDWAQMNHYALKSIDSYALRKLRGNVNNKPDKYNAAYWALQDRNEVEDRTVLRHADGRASILQDLLRDPVLRDLHDAARDRVEAQLANHRETPAYRDLKAELLEASRVPIARVEAKPPKPRDPDKIAAVMGGVKKPAVAKPAAARIPEESGPFIAGEIDLSAGTGHDWVPNHDIPLPADPRIFAPEALKAVLSGRFERRHARHIAGYLDGCTRLLEIGTGVGFIPLRAIRIGDGLTVFAQDNRRPLIEAARCIARRAGLDDAARLTFSTKPLRSDVDADATAQGFSSMLRDFRPTVLRIARSGDLPPEILAAQDLGPLRRVVIPVLSDGQAQDLRSRYGPALSAAGFAEDIARAAAGSLQYDRGP